VAEVGPTLRLNAPLRLLNAHEKTTLAEAVEAAAATPAAATRDNKVRDMNKSS